MRFSDFILSWKQSDSHIVGFIVRYIKNRALYRCNVLTTGNVVIRGMRKMRVDGRLSIGIGNAAFSLPSDKTYLLIDGTLESRGMTRISRGCRVQVAKDASLLLENCFINCDTKVICTHGISIGAGTAIGWGCQLCDEDFHSVKYANTLISTMGGGNSQIYNKIQIGERVLIGNNCYIYKGVNIPNGCVVASNSVVKRSFVNENMLIAGNPAKEIKPIRGWT